VVPAAYDARYVPTGTGIARLKMATHLLHQTEAVVRFSNGSPDVHADDRTRGVRGMAVKFLDRTRAIAWLPRRVVQGAVAAEPRDGDVRFTRCSPHRGIRCNLGH